MSEIDNFYQKIIKEINELINEKKYESALNVVREELEAQYIPNIYFDKLKKIESDLLFQINFDKIEKKFGNFSKEELVGKIISNNQINLPIFEYYVSKFFHDKNENKINNFLFSQIFENKTIDNITKLYCLRILKSFEFDNEITFFNINTNSSFNLKISDNWDFYDSKYFIEVNKYIDEFSYKNPSINLIEKDLLQLIFSYYFNSTPPYSSYELGTIIDKYVNDSFSSDKKLDNDIKKWLEKVLENKTILN